MNFLEVIKQSFIKCLETHANSNEKLKILHGAIAEDIKEKLGDNYHVISLGISDNKEEHIAGKGKEEFSLMIDQLENQYMVNRLKMNLTKI